ncbi:RNA polymerase sigma factor [Actinomadura luteofluorescens]|uniref:RNA polymerase sigma factor n=1 Tax=Actinomadura luteofluorescens TaxID=46163 RepID=UPI003D8FDFD5
MLRRNRHGQEVIDEDAVFRDVLKHAEAKAKNFGLTPDQVEEITSTVAMSLCMRSDTLMQIVKEGRDTKAYVQTVTRNEFINHIKRAQRDRARDALVRGFEAVNDSGDRTPDNSTRVTDKITLQQAMGGLDDELLVITFMHIYEDKSLPKISEELGVPYGTVKSRYLRALKQLREAILGDELDAEVE